MVKIYLLQQLILCVSFNRILAITQVSAQELKCRISNHYRHQDSFFLNLLIYRRLQFVCCINYKEHVFTAHISSRRIYKKSLLLNAIVEWKQHRQTVFFRGTNDSLFSIRVLINAKIHWNAKLFALPFLGEGEVVTHKNTVKFL